MADPKAACFNEMREVRDPESYTRFQYARRRQQQRFSYHT